MVAVTRNTPHKDRNHARTPGKSPGPSSAMKLGMKSPGVHKKVAASPAKASPYQPPRNSRAKLRRSTAGVSSQHVSYELMTKFDVSLYQRYSKRALADRKRRGAGRSQEMNTLYRFWSYYLRETHDAKMYSDFKTFASEDARRSYMYGLQTLFRYYSYGLEASFCARRWRDFQEEVVKEAASESFYGLEKLVAFLKFRGPDAPWAPILPEVRKLIKTHTDSSGAFVGPKAAAVGEDGVEEPSVSQRRVLAPMSGNVMVEQASASFKTPSKTPSRQSKRNTLNPFASCFVPTKTDSPVGMSMTPTPFRATRSHTPAKSPEEGDWSMVI